ncbi:hypothetical protein, partial [Acidiplasma aeolicum]|uniref:hypothetical protein n=1 Tax=Acidiplasma aeolicum TaxID=507754 RepID=UPI001F23B956
YYRFYRITGTMNPSGLWKKIVMTTMNHGPYRIKILEKLQGHYRENGIKNPYDRYHELRPVATCCNRSCCNKIKYGYEN